MFLFYQKFYVLLDTIELKDITANGLRAVLDFIYTGELSLSIENIGMFNFFYYDEINFMNIA